jgi:hypothetical protein
LAAGAPVEVQTEAIRALCNVARTEANGALLIRDGALAPIVSLLRSQNVELQWLAVVGLTNLSAVGDSTQACIDAGAMEPLAVLCTSSDPKISQMAKQCLAKLQREPTITGGVEIPYVDYRKSAMIKTRRIREEDLEIWKKSATPVGHTVQCRIKRDKVTGYYDCFLDDNTSFKFLMSAQKKKSKTANYHISGVHAPPYRCPAVPLSCHASQALVLGFGMDVGNGCGCGFVGWICTNHCSRKR